jgi:glycosyltransferase involved in cell wall biosynthesis
VPKELNVLHVSTPQSWRGGEQQLAYLVSHLQKLKVPQSLMVPSQSVMEGYCQKQNLPYCSAPKKGGLPFGFAKALSQYAKANQATLLHAHDSHAHTACILATVFYGLKLPIIVSRRVDFKVGKSWFSRYKYNHPLVKRILCVSEAIKDIMATCIKRPERLQVVYSGVDLGKFPAQAPGLLRKEFGLSPDVPLIGNVAALADHKDHFFIIGAGELKENLEHYALAKNLQEVVSFTGFRKDVNQLLPELDAFLFTSKTEGLGTSVLDAFTAKVPVVATAGGGIPELVKHQETGLLASVKDAEALAKHLQLLFSDAALRAKLTENALGFVKDFAKENTAEQTLGVYEAVLTLP